MIPYVLTPMPYRHNSAGIRALHRLIHEINQRGIPAYADNGNPAWFERPLAAYAESIAPIMIYPEVVSGNPFGMERVVRWTLNTPGYLAGDTSYAPTERVFTWSKRFYDAPLLTVDVLEHELFNADGTGVRDTDCFYVGKGPKRGANKDASVDGMTEITLAFPPTRAEVAALLRRTRTLYTYDDCTSLTDEAIDCGCEVILLPEGTPLSRNPLEDHGARIDAFIAATQDW
jgi:O-antigen biosynthesis protein